MSAYIWLALLAALAFALSNLLQKYASKHGIGNIWALCFYLYLTTFPFVLLIPLFKPISWPAPAQWVLILLYAAAHFLGRFFFAGAVSRVDASTFAPFFQLQAAFIAILAFLFLGESFAPQQYFLVGLMLTGAALVTIDERFTWRSLLSLGAVLLIIQQFIHAFANIFAGQVVRSLDVYTFFFWGSLTTTGFSLLLLPLFSGPIRAHLKHTKPLLASGALTVIASLALFTAYQTNVTVSSALGLLSSPLVLALTIIVSLVSPQLLEHHTPKVYAVRFAGVICLVCGALLLLVG